MTLTATEGAQLATRLLKADVIVDVGFVERFNPIVDEIVRMSRSPHLIELSGTIPALRGWLTAWSSRSYNHDVDILLTCS
jgi:predicted dehydrogenase